jgi:plasmid stabilization system protein ParE
MAVWAPAALADLKDAWDHIAANNEAAADRIVGVVEEAGNRLDRFPRMGRPGKLAGSREFSIPRTPYYLVYYTQAAEVEIARVMHTARQWP